jgi:hypothetical protein
MEVVHCRKSQKSGMQHENWIGSLDSDPEATQPLTTNRTEESKKHVP